MRIAPSRRPSRRASAAALSLAALFGAGMVTAAPAEATASLGTRAVIEASHHVGQPYVWGAAGPTRFDCSGFTMYVYGRLGKRLPHNAALQYNARGVRHIAKASRIPGDLIFIKESNGRIGHVAIWAGNGRWWVAPKTGDHVKLQYAYTSNYVVGRVT